MWAVAPQVLPGAQELIWSQMGGWRWGAELRALGLPSQTMARECPHPCCCHLLSLSDPVLCTWCPV